MGYGNTRSAQFQQEMEWIEQFEAAKAKFQSALSKYEEAIDKLGNFYIPNQPQNRKH